jgi:hypothetical protein
MGRWLHTLRLLGGALAVVLGLAGCSGPGAPAVSGGAADLRDAAADHLSSLFLVKAWFSVLHVRHDVRPPAGPCKKQTEVLPLEPGDPPGTTRRRFTSRNCTVTLIVTFPDGSGTQTVTRANGRSSSLTWTAGRHDGTWLRQQLVQTFWDGAELTYESGINTASVDDEQYLVGVARLQDGRKMDFRVERSRDFDKVLLDLADGARLEAGVAVHTIPGAIAWPVFSAGADGVYARANGAQQAFRLWSTGPDRWERSEFTSAHGPSGRFTLGGNLSGSGQIRNSRALLGTLAWSDAFEGELTPVQASAIAVVPSAAARDFAIDQWIASLAALGPGPQY